MTQQIRSFEDIREGQELPPLTKQPTTQQLVMYAGAEDDYFQGHYDHPFATATGMPSVFNHGWLTFAFMCQAVTDWIPLEAGLIKKASARYRMPNFPGNPIVCSGKVVRKTVENGEKIVELELWANNGEGATTTTGTALLSMF